MVLLDLFVQASVFFHDNALAGMGLLAAFALWFARDKRVVFMALVATLFLSGFVKEIVQEPRPCVFDDGLVPCPSEFGFPSIHAALAGVLLFSAIGLPEFLVFLPLSLLVAYSRIFLGVHSFIQVAAGFALGASVFLLARDFFGKRVEKTKPTIFGKASELMRQLVHVFFGLAIIALVVLAGYFNSLVVLFALLLLGVLFVDVQVKLKKQDLFYFVWHSFERPGAMGKGALSYVAGAILALTFITPLPNALAVIAVLAAGDGFSTIAGIYFGRHKLFFNQRKSWEGLAAFVLLGGAAASFFVQPANAFFYAFVLALVEALDTRLEDNLLIPAAGIIMTLLT